MPRLFFDQKEAGIVEAEGKATTTLGTENQSRLAVCAYCSFRNATP